MVIAGCILTTYHKKFIVGTFFGIIANHIPFTLLSDDITDKTFFAFEIISYCLGFIRSFSVFENRSSLHVASSIGHTVSIHRAAIHVHGNNLSTELYLFIVHLAFAVQMRITALGKDNGIISLINNGSTQRLFLFSRTLQNG
ncbi:hypothetical protein SDC9_129489 [bioreactor metagenome]|uniref:Uncharacterized protein n=1 Tax=bioreactor metagenome TaxID=1076179 RepID=A0A645CZZ4_9ZZZZ